LIKAYEELFSRLPDVHFFAKDQDGKFLVVNRAFAEKCGFTSPDNLVGLTDLDVWPKYLGEKYSQDDQEIFRTGQARTNVVELVFDGDKSTEWYSTTKIPILDGSGKVAGIVGFTRDLKRVDNGSLQFIEMGEVFDYIMANFRRPIDIRKLASMACLSLSQFERKFKSLFQMPPQQSLATVRIHSACRALVNTREQISTVASENGFYDLSHLNRLLKRQVGLTPSQYRKQYSQGQKLVPPTPFPEAMPFKKLRT